MRRTLFEPGRCRVWSGITRLSLFFSFLFFYTALISPCPCLFSSSFQPSAGAPSRGSQPVASSLRATQRRTSTTCTARGPSRRRLEAPSGPSNTVCFPSSTFYFSDCVVLCFRVPPLHTVPIYPPICRGIHHFHERRRNQSSVAAVGQYLISCLVKGSATSESPGLRKSGVCGCFLRARCHTLGQESLLASF